MDRITTRQIVLKLVSSALKCALLGMGGSTNFLIIRNEFIHKHKFCSKKDFENAFGLVWLIPGPAASKLLCYLSYRTLQKIWVPLIIAVVFSIPGILAIYGLHFLGTLTDARLLRHVTAVIAFAFMFNFCLGSIFDHLQRNRRHIGPSLFAISASFLLSVTTPLGILHQIIIYLVGSALLILLPKIQIRRNKTLAVEPWIWLLLLQTGLTIYGGAYAMIAHLYDQLSLTHALIPEHEFWYAVGLGHATPGPLMKFVCYFGLVLNAPWSGILMAFVLLVPPCMLTAVLVHHEARLLKIDTIKRVCKYFFPYLIVFIFVYGLNRAVESLQSGLVTSAFVLLATVQVFWPTKFVIYLTASVGLGVLTFYL